MQRIKIQPRPNSAERLESVGLSFHAWDNYWNETACYKFTLEQIEELERATNTLNQMCYQAIDYIIEHKRFNDLGIPEQFWQPIIDSWDRDDFTLYGRFDFAYDGGENPPKMLEYNADTPTSLLESAVAQWYWLQDVFPAADQFNSLHEKLVEQWKYLATKNKVDTIHFASISDNEEDWVSTHYLMETAIQAGIIAKHIYLEDIGYDPKSKAFVDLNGIQMQALFKLYPWEWIMHDEFGKYIADSTTKFIEPMWKALLSNKGLLPILWELFPEHPNLLPAYFEPGKLESYAIKPLCSREGANIKLFENGQQLVAAEGPYDEDHVVYQQLIKLSEFDGKFPIVGSWVVGDEAAGVCIREDKLLITTNMSNFVPHYFEE